MSISIESNGESHTQEGDVLIVGLSTAVWSMSRNHCAWLANRPEYLLVHRLGKNGKLGKAVYKWPLRHGKKVKGTMSVVDSAIAQKFLSDYPAMQSYFIYDRHQLEIAQLNVKDFSGYGWSLSQVPDTVCRWMNTNKYFYGLYNQSKQEQESRIYDARQKNLQLMSDWYKDEDLSGVFDSYMGRSKPTLSEDNIYEKITEQLDNVARIEKTIQDTPSLGLDWTDYQERNQAQKALANLIGQYHAQLPKNGLGMIDFSEIRKNRVMV